MNIVFTPFTIRHVTLKNRIVMPPMVAFGLGSPDGMPSESNAVHYARRARGGAGLIIVEAACVHRDGKLHAGQLGLWEDAQIEGHQRIADSVHVYGCPIMVQLHHSGLNAVTEKPFTASFYEGIKGGQKLCARAMTPEEIEMCIRWFIDAAKRAHEAGYDGVELHAAHSYLLSQFLSAGVNKRTDAYGASVENRARMATEIIRGIRKTCGENFIIGVRMGFNEPDAKTSGEIIQYLEQAGMDLCHISTGYLSIDTVAAPPQEFAFSKRVYGAKLVRSYADVPVIAVGEVRDTETAEAILQADIADLVAIGRGLLADEDLVYKSEQGRPEDVYTCLNCRDDQRKCSWTQDGMQCPQQLRAKRDKLAR